MEEPSQSLINVNVSDTAGLSKPADTLVNRFFDAVGPYLDTRKEVWKAKAEQQVKLIQAKGAAKLTDYERKVALRRLEEDTKHQRNLEKIAQKALPLLQQNAEQARPEEIDPDWMAQFLEKARLVSNEEMQTLWAKILAGEACKPGAFSKKTLSIVADVDKHIAETFMRLRSLCFTIDNVLRVIVPELDGIENWFDFDSCSHLQALGLVHVDSQAGFMEVGFPEVIDVFYGDRKLRLNLKARPEKGGNNTYTVPTGLIILTRYGHEVAHVCSFEPREGFFEAVIEFWANLDPQEIKHESNDSLN